MKRMGISIAAVAAIAVALISFISLLLGVAVNSTGQGPQGTADQRSGSAGAAGEFTYASPDQCSAGRAA